MSKIPQMKNIQKFNSLILYKKRKKRLETLESIKEIVNTFSKMKSRNFNWKKEYPKSDFRTTKGKMVSNFFGNRKYKAIIIGFVRTAYLREYTPKSNNKHKRTIYNYEKIIVFCVYRNNLYCIHRNGGFKV